MMANAKQAAYAQQVLSRLAAVFLRHPDETLTRAQVAKILLSVTFERQH